MGTTTTTHTQTKKEKTKNGMRSSTSGSYSFLIGHQTELRDFYKELVRERERERESREMSSATMNSKRRHVLVVVDYKTKGEGCWNRTK